MYDTSLQFIHTQGIQSHIHANIQVSENVSEISEKSENFLLNAKLTEIRKYPTYGQTVISESIRIPFSIRIRLYVWANSDKRCVLEVIFLLYVKLSKLKIKRLPPGPLGSVVLGQDMDISGNFFSSPVGPVRSPHCTTLRSRRERKSPP